MTINIIRDRYSVALALWREQHAAGIGDVSQTTCAASVDDWLAEHTDLHAALDAAAAGEVAAIVAVRTAAGLPIFA